MYMEYIRAFIVGGLICVIAQILMDKTNLTPGRILVLFVTLGVILGAFGLYDKLVEICRWRCNCATTRFREFIS